MLSSETFAGSVLIDLGILIFNGTRHEDDEWPKWTRANLDDNFANMFVLDNRTVIAVDRRNVHYVVRNMDDVERVWRTDPIVYALVIPSDVFGKYRGNVVFTPIPQFEPA